MSKRAKVLTGTLLVGDKKVGTAKLTYSDEFTLADVKRAVDHLNDNRTDKLGTNIRLVGPSEVQSVKPV